MKSFSCFYPIAVAIMILSAAKSLTASECRILWIHPEQAPLSIAKGRVYREIIDRTIAKYRYTPSIVEHDGPEEMIGTLMSMMADGRIDALVAYPMEAQYVANGMKIEVFSLPVAGMDDFGLTSVGCSKTKEGMEIIQKLNTIILKHRTKPEFMSFTEQWLDPAARERHRPFTRQAFGR